MFSKSVASPMSTFSLRMSTFTEVMFTFYAATHLIRLFRKNTSNTGRIGLTRCAIFWLRYHQPACSSSYAFASKKPMHSSYALTDERGAPTVCLCLWYGKVIVKNSNHHVGCSGIAVEIRVVCYSQIITICLRIIAFFSCCQYTDKIVNSI